MLDWPGKTRKLSSDAVVHRDGPLDTGCIVGDYEVEKKLAEGGFGTVYAAVHPMIGKRVAIKLLRRDMASDPDAVSRFIGEARAVNAIGHNNIVDIFGFGQLDDERYFYVMELLDGMSLKDHIEKEGGLEPAFTIDILRGVASALAAAHERDIVHRDLKPDNIFVTRHDDQHPQGKLLDFGIAKLSATIAKKLDHETVKGSAIGTPYYMAPEQALGQTVDVRTDVYAFGVCCFHALTGRVPFDGFDLMTIAKKHATAERPRVSRHATAVSKAFDEPIRRMMAIAPSERPATITEAFASLEAAARRCGIQLASLSPAKPTSRIPAIAVVLLSLTCVAGGYWLWRDTARSGAGDGVPASSAIDRGRLAAFLPLEQPPPSATNQPTPAKIALGKRLFHDKQLSRQQDISCSSCHDLADNGADHAVKSTGHAGQLGLRNTPTVFNVAGAFALHWDGAHSTLEQQAVRPLTSPRVMAISEETLVERLTADADYKKAFEEAFPTSSAPSMANVGRALAAFQTQLFTPSRWDAYLRGDTSQLTDDEKRGFNTFVQVGCPTCHYGPRVGLTMYQKLGLVKPWPRSTDSGRHGVTKQEADWMVFRVPTLRNVEKTDPYLHDGSVAELSEVVRLMARHQLGKELSTTEVDLIVTWLKTLSGELPSHLLPDSQPPAK